jgi:hypothetical protein
MRTQIFQLFSSRLLSLLIGTVLCGGCEKSVETLPKYVVSGTVRVNGKPAAGVMITLVPAGETASGPFARLAAGVTDAEGDFELSTIVEGDGAFPGEYTATFKWLESNEFPPRDRFGGAFSDAKASNFPVTIEASENVLEPFQLEFANAGS